MSAHAAPIHLRPTAPLAERVLLPGDPGRALTLAQAMLSEPRMFNHNRGLWGYTGLWTDGEPLTIQATGMGGPSAAIVLTELIHLGARRAIRVGTCGALAPQLGLGDLVIATGSICADGTSRALGAGESIDADGDLTARLIAAAPDAHSGRVVTVDLFYDDRDLAQIPGASAALAVEMEAATLFAVGAGRGAAVACVVSVSDTFDGRGERIRIDDETLAKSAEAMGRLAAAALPAGS
jgi:DeoD family purine-nucleoside phosphorylase